MNRRKIGKHWWETNEKGNYVLSPTKRKLKRKSDTGPFITDDINGLY